MTLEGRRPLLAEVQALVARNLSPNVRRTTIGMDPSRTLMIVAVLQNSIKIPLYEKDVYVSTVWEPTADLAVALAIASASANRNFPGRVVALGEVGLAGDLRRVPGLERRLAEAARLGFTDAITPLPPPGVQVSVPKGMRLAQVPSLNDALATLDLRPQRPSRP